MLKARNQKTDVLITCAAVLTLIFIALLAKFISRDIENYRYDYKGESEHWAAEFTGYSTIEFYKKDGTLKTKNDAQATITVTFKGDLPELLAAREFGFKSFRSSGSRTSSVGFDKKTFTWNPLVSGPLQDTEKLEVTLDGKTEIIEMRSR